MAKELSSVSLRAAKVQPPAAPGASGLTTLALAIGVIVALHLGKAVFIPLVFAVLLSLVLGPVVNLLPPMCRAFPDPGGQALSVTSLSTSGTCGP